MNKSFVPNLLNLWSTVHKLSVVMFPTYCPLQASIAPLSKPNICLTMDILSLWIATLVNSTVLQNSGVGGISLRSCVTSWSWSDANLVNWWSFSWSHGLTRVIGMSSRRCLPSFLTVINSSAQKLVCPLSNRYSFFISIKKKKEQLLSAYWQRDGIQRLFKKVLNCLHTNSPILTSFSSDDAAMPMCYILLERIVTEASKVKEYLYQRTASLVLERVLGLDWTLSK